MKKNYFKKSLSLIMTVLMLMSCWVFVAPTEAEAAALETASALYNKAQLNGINTNIDTTMTTVLGKFKDPNMEGDENASYHVSQYGSQHYKNIYYSPTVTTSMPAAKMTGISNIDSVMVYYPETVMIYDGSTKPQMGVVACVDGGNYAVRALSVYISANANGIVITDHWKGSTTANLAHIINMHNGSYQMSNDGNEHSSYKHNTADHGEWYFYASDLRFDGTLASDEFVRTITPTWGFYGAYYRYYWLGNQTGSLTKITDVADTNIYVMNVKAYRDLLTTINTDKTNITNNAGQYTPESVKAYVTAANAILNLNPKNVSQSGSAVKTWGSNMSTALTNYNTAKNGLKNREYEVTYDNMFSLADWKYSASSEKANVTTDLTNGKVTVQNTNASGEYVTPHSGNSTNANTRNTSNYAMPVVGGQEYVFKYTTDHADTQMFAFFYDANGGHTGTYGAYNLTVKNGTGQATFKAPDNATQMEIRFDNNTGATTANFWDIMIYPAAVKTELGVDNWTNRPIRTVYAYNASVGTLPTPVRPGYIFDGWKEDTNGDGIGDAAISGTVTKSRVLYSSWKPGTMDVGYDNLFSLAAWANTKSNGKGNTTNTTNIVVDLDAGTIAVSGKSDAYTTYGGGSDQYHVPVTAGETYIFDYDATSTNGTYQAFVFFYNDAGSGVTGAIYNGSAQSNAHIGLYNGQPITFTVPSGCTKVGFRVGICGDAEGTATYSNIGVYKKADYDAYAKNYEKVREAFLIGDTKNLMTPTREGYNFEGWTLADGTKVTSTAGFDANTTVYANWSRNFTVTYYYGDNTTVLATKTVKEGETVGALPTVVPTKDTTAEYSYEFSYWYANGTKFTADTVITADLSVFPVFNNIAHSDFTFTLVKASTCTANATVTKKCGNCSYSFGDVTYNPAEDANAASHTGWLAKGHDYSAGEILANSSTGNTDADTHSIKCARYDTCKSVEKVAHSWAGSDPEGATCTTPGTINWSCPCGAEKTTTGDIAADAHNYDETTGTPNGDNETHTVACTYDAGHTKSVACTDADNNCECDICGQELIHVYDQKTETYKKSDADCVNDAVYYYTCKCGKQGTETWIKTGTKVEHTYTNYVYNNDAKCGVDGTKTAECDTCDTGATNTITAEGTAREHEFTGAIKDNENGTHSYKCKYDDCDVYGGTVNCTYGEWDTSDSDYHVATCTACGYELKGEHDWTHWATTDEYKQADGQHSRSCYVCYKEVVKNCTYTRYSYAETCTTDGYTRNSCEYCGHNYKTNIIGKTGHDYTGAVKSYNNGQHSFLCVNGCNTYGYAGVENARTTCTYEYTNTAAGAHKATCTACNYSFDEACSGGHASCTTLKVCDKCNTEYGVTDPHSFTGTVVELEGDKHAYLCEYCSTAGLYGVGADKGATEDCFGGTATCKDLAVCTKCSDTYGSLAAHTFDGEAVKLEGDVHAYRCSVCKDDTLYGVGTTINDTVACSGGTATCKDLAVCDICKDTHGDYAPHTFDGDAVKLEGDVHAYRCSVCEDATLYGVGTTINDTVACSGGTATCTALAVCDICKDTHGELDAEAHKWGDWANVANTETHKRVCEYNADHIETADCFTPDIVVVAPDCETPGYTLNTCAICDHEWHTAPTEALGHDWSAWVKNNNGTHTRTCQDETCKYGENGGAKVETASCTKENADAVVTKPTCTEDGYTTYTCKDCGYVWEADATDATGHSYTEKTKKTDSEYQRSTQDCVTDWTYWYRCDNCDVSAETEKDKYENEADLYWVREAATGHKFDAKTQKYLATAATCTAKATYYYSCSVCDASSKGTVDEKTYESGQILGHKWEKPAEENLADYLATKSDCITDATYYYVCDRTDCGISSKDYDGSTWTDLDSKSGHDFTDGYTEGAAATCTTDGVVEHYTCQICGKHFKADMTTEIAADKLTINALKHDLEDVAAKAATCEENGYTKHKQCQREGCDYRKDYEEIPAKGHDFKAENGYYVDSVYNYHAYYCSNCDAYGVDGVKYATDYSEMDLAVVGGIKCEFTGEYVNYDAADGTHSHKLNCVCGNVSSAVCADAEPQRVAPTCTENAKYVNICDVCSFEWTVEGTAEADQALGHDLAVESNGDGTHSIACQRDNCDYAEATEKCATETPATICGTYDICDTCKSAFGDVKPHVFTNYVSDNNATCTEDGTKTAICDTCTGEDKAKDTVADKGSALGHDMSDFGYSVEGWTKMPEDFDATIIKEATCHEEGVKISFCARCDYYETQQVPSDPNLHVWEKDENGELVWTSVGGNCATGVTKVNKCTAESCRATQTKTEPAAHKWSIVYIEKAGCVTYGYIDFVCDECGFTGTLEAAEGKTEFDGKDYSGDEYGIVPVGSHDFEKHASVTGDFAAFNGEIVYVDDEGNIAFVEKFPEYNADGYAYKCCKICTAKEKVVLEAMGKQAYDEDGDLVHKHAEYATINEDGTITYKSTLKTNAYVAPTCTVGGHKDYEECMRCSFSEYMLNRDEVYLEPLGHSDANNDGKCDTCKATVKNDASDSCGCACHKESGFMKFIYKILRFFWKLFKINKTCGCGYIHY